MTRTTRIAAALAALLGLALLGAPEAASAYDSVSGFAYVEDRDLQHMIVTVRGLKLAVKPSSVLIGLHGTRLQLGELRVPQYKGAAIDPSTADAVYFEASRQIGGLVLEKLKLLGSLPD
ncbi:MAG: hypothetical protein JSU66_06150 [Deltaproteobacteria bacterium]|nr:MAG: hypothetical protein JSU66_06150 [Deltaproteobacteria bacterium]